MIFLEENYYSDAADAMYGSYVKEEDVEVTRASRLFAQSTFTKISFNHIMKTKETKTKMRILCGYTSAHQVHQHTKRMGSICLVMGAPFKKELWGCL